MHVTSEQKLLVQTTFAQVLPIADTAANLFYTRLFEIDPTSAPCSKAIWQSRAAS